MIHQCLLCLHMIIEERKATELREIYRRINDAKHVVAKHLRLETHLESKTRLEFLGNTCILVNRFHK